MFFFKQKTAYEMRISDWSSDVFSSDLAPHLHKPVEPGRQTDDERPFQRVELGGRRRFGEDRNIRGVVTAIGEIDAGRGFRRARHAGPDDVGLVADFCTDAVGMRDVELDSLYAREVSGVEPNLADRARTRI